MQLSLAFTCNIKVKQGILYLLADNKSTLENINKYQQSIYDQFEASYIQCEI